MKDTTNERRCIECLRVMDEARTPSPPLSIAQAAARDFRLRSSPAYIAAKFERMAMGRALAPWAAEAEMTPEELAEQDAAREVFDEVLGILKQLHGEREAAARLRRILADEPDAAVMRKRFLAALGDHPLRDPDRAQRVVMKYAERITEPGVKRHAVVGAIAKDEGVTAQYVREVLRAAGMGRKVMR